MIFFYLVAPLTAISIVLLIVSIDIFEDIFGKFLMIVGIFGYLEVAINIGEINIDWYLFFFFSYISIFVCIVLYVISYYIKMIIKLKIN